MSGPQEPEQQAITADEIREEATGQQLSGGENSQPTTTTIALSDEELQRHSTGALAPLPEETLMRILSYCDPITLDHCDITCRRLHTALCNDGTIYRNIFYSFRLHQDMVYKRAKKRGAAWATATGPESYRTIVRRVRSYDEWRRLCSGDKPKESHPLVPSISGCVSAQSQRLQNELRREVIRYSVVNPPTSRREKFCSHTKIDVTILSGGVRLSYACPTCGYNGTFQRFGYHNERVYGWDCSPR
eukprot:PhM_4_TR13548/c0_g1_i1/m.34775